MKKIVFVFLFLSFGVQAQKNITTASDATAPLHALKPDYPTPYGVPAVSDIQKTIDRIFDYLERATPSHFVDKSSGEIWNPTHGYSDQVVFAKGDFRPISYEWGVTYSGMLDLYRLTGEVKYRDYVFKRLELISTAIESARSYDEVNKLKPHTLKGLIQPKALDDIGAMAMAVLKAKKSGFSSDMSYVTQRASDFILKEEHRLPDGTLVRIRPLKNTMWLDDVYMSIPALLQLGVANQQESYFDESFKQFSAYQKRMFNPTLNVFMHGYLEGAEEHPEFHWARANGWALLTTSEMLMYLPANHPGRKFMLGQLKNHLKGLMSLQDGTGFWHQLLDKNDSYLETSATAIYAYVIANAINKGWLDPKIYAPAAILAWNAVNSRVNAQGQVEGTCVGTGLAWDPAFYYFRPISPFAAHGYGPTLLAGSAMMEMLKKYSFEINDSAVHLSGKGK
jgi:rhamnogalacturonyl hydrolase YesR